MLESVEGSLYSVDTISRAERLGNDVLDTGCVTYETDCTTCDDTCSGDSRLQENRCALEVAHDVVRDGCTLYRNLDDGSLSLLGSLSDCVRDVVGLSEAVAYSAVAVTDYNECRE